jgi:HD domain-containing protein
VETAIGKTREETNNKLADKIDSFERYSQPHSRLMGELAAVLATRLGLGDHDVDAIAEAAMLHDIGLLAMAPAYHSSAGPLSFEQRLDLWRHSVVGEQQMAKRESGRYAQLMVRWHHEWWNGSGYPDGLAFEDIPIGARILRAVELICSLLVERPYRPAFTEHDAVEVLKSSAGVECDPYVVKALLSVLDELIEEEPRIEQARTPGELFDHGDHPSSSPAFETEVAETSLAVETSSDIPIESRPNERDGVIPSPIWQTQPAEETELVASHPQGATVESSAGLHEPAAAPEAPSAELRRPSIPAAQRILAKLPSIDRTRAAAQWPDWQRSSYTQKSLLGFEASVLRQIDFRSIALPFCGTARLDWYLKTWGRHIFANDPRASSATIARAIFETQEALAEAQIASIVEDVYIPRTRLTNPELRRWFSETDAWWMDNLRRNIDSIQDHTLRAQALMIGMQTGDYALSFDEQTRDLRLPLTALFWRLAGRAVAVVGHPANRAFHMPADEFIKHARADLLFLRLPSSQPGAGESKFDWKESWVLQSSERPEQLRQLAGVDSRHSYLMMVDRLLRPASHINTWAIGYQELGLATAQDVLDVIKEHRHVRATYSKDVTEVAGGLRSFIIVADKAPPR